MKMECPKVSRMWHDLQKATSRLVFGIFFIMSIYKFDLNFNWHMCMYEYCYASISFDCQEA